MTPGRTNVSEFPVNLVLIRKLNRAVGHLHSGRGEKKRDRAAGEMPGYDSVFRDRKGLRSEQHPFVSLGRRTRRISEQLNAVIQPVLDDIAFRSALLFAFALIFEKALMNLALRLHGIKIR